MLNYEIKSWNIEEMTGYHPFTTDYEDFSIADHFGEEAIKDTFNRMFAWEKEDYRYLTEMVMALNWKSWEHYETNPSYCRLYVKLFNKADAYARKNLKGEELAYYYRTTD